MLDLQRISREGDSNFDVPLEGAPTLQCLEVVRRIAGRRLVCRGVWQGQAVFAKLFIGNRSQRYADRDARGAKALISHQLLAPELLHEGDIAGQSGIALIYAYVAESQNAEGVWQGADAQQRRLRADALVRTAFFDGTILAWQVVIPDFGTVSGPFQITALEYAGAHDGELTFDLALESAGQLAFGAL